ncbi:MAG: NAD(P)/FAD-dependent oxidoreductase [Chloroflexi bacterium]|nr:NAD(P)/FAD-dependent oxidoreductase [Chloroflexota bacterium]
MPKYVIVGNSAGGVGAAEAIREVDPCGSLAIVSDEPTPAYSRPGIAELVAGAKTVERIVYRDDDFYRKLRIETYFGRPAVRIGLAERKVYLEDGEELEFEKLLLATGGTPIRPPMEGADRAGVLSFTTVADALALRARLAAIGSGAGGEASRVLVIGAGLIGAACSDALVRAGVKPIVVELRDRPLNLLLDEPASELARRAMVKAGVELICNATVKEVLGRPDDDRSVGGAVLADGRRTDCGAVVVAVGVRPRMDLAAKAGLKVNRGVVVDQRMETSEPGIYACGDVAEAYDCIYGGNRVVPIWPGAYRGGRVAGFNMAGRSALSEDATVMNTIKYFGMSLVSAGEINVGGQDGYETLRRLDLDGPDAGRYRKVILKDNRVVGFVFAGEIERSGIVNWLLRQKVDVSRFKDKLLSDSFDLIDLPAELRRAHYGEATISQAQRQLGWGRRLSHAASPRTNGGIISGN